MTALLVAVASSMIVDQVFKAVGIVPEEGTGEWFLVIGVGVASGASLFLLMQRKLLKF
jgi:hypothetical protein